MKNKITVVTFAFLLLLSFSTNSFAKKLEKDEQNKTVSSKVVKKEQTAIKTTTVVKENSSKSETEVKTTYQESLNQILKDYTPTAKSSMAGEQINWQVLSTGGNQATSANFILTSTIGQTAVGIGISSNYQLNAGFLQVFGPQGCCIVDRGNVDGGADDGTFPGSVDIGDLVYLVAFMFQGGVTPTCIEEADIDGSGGAIPIDIADLVALVSFMFQGGVPPLPC